MSIKMRNAATFIKILNEIIEKRANNRLKKYDITISQIRVLGILYRIEGKCCSLKEVEAFFDVSQQTINGIIKRLETKKLLESFQDLKDKRTKKIRLTSKGRAMCRRLTKEIHEMDNWILSALTKEEQSQLYGLLNKIFVHIKENEGVN